MKALGRVLIIAGLSVAPVAAFAAPATDSSISSSVIAPRDVGSGASVGRRMHKPFTITKEWSSRDSASADCTALHATLSTAASGKLVCTGDLDGDGMSDVCTRATAMGAVCKP
jgi:hypothetical protein